MKTVTVSDMMCSHCKDRIEKGLAAEKITAQVTLENKTVTVADADLTKTLAVLEDLGFDAKAD